MKNLEHDLLLWNSLYRFALVPCRICGSFNRSTCRECKRYINDIFIHSPNLFAAKSLIKDITEHFKNGSESKSKEINKNEELYLWDDYEKDDPLPDIEK